MSIFNSYVKLPEAYLSELPSLVANFSEFLGMSRPTSAPDLQVTLLYGDADWMDASGGAWLAHQLGRRTEVMVVENAGDSTGVHIFSWDVDMLKWS